jgi:hypothetical protein
VRNLVACFDAIDLFPQSIVLFQEPSASAINEPDDVPDHFGFLCPAGGIVTVETETHQFPERDIPRMLSQRGGLSQQYVRVANFTSRNRVPVSTDASNNSAGTAF